MTVPGVDLMQACPRCGTFAVLVGDEFRRFCAPCVQVLRQPAESTGGDAVKLLMASGRVFRQIGWLAVGLQVGFALPEIVGTLLGMSGFVQTGLSLVLGSFVEALILATWLRRSLQGDTAAPLQWRRAAQAFVGALVVNLITVTAVNVGLLLCGAGLFLAGPLSAAIPILVFEKTGPVDAVVLAWKRSAGQRVALGMAAFVLALPTTVFSSISSVLFVLGSSSLARPTWLGPGQAVFVTLATVANTLPRLFQVVAWLATRPLPPMPTAVETPPQAEAGAG
jgi:hypothetical protein